MFKQIVQLCFILAGFLQVSSTEEIGSTPSPNLLQFSLTNITAIGPWNKDIFIFLDGRNYLRVPKDRLGPQQLNLTGLELKSAKRDMLPLEDKAHGVNITNSVLVMAPSNTGINQTYLVWFFIRYDGAHNSIVFNLDANAYSVLITMPPDNVDMGTWIALPDPKCFLILFPGGQAAMYEFVARNYANMTMRFQDMTGIEARTTNFTLCKTDGGIQFTALGTTCAKPLEHHAKRGFVAGGRFYIFSKSGQVISFDASSWDKPGTTVPLNEVSFRDFFLGSSAGSADSATSSNIESSSSSNVVHGAWRTVAIILGIVLVLLICAVIVHVCIIMPIQQQKNAQQKQNADKKGRKAKKNASRGKMVSDGLKRASSGALMKNKPSSSAFARAKQSRTKLESGIAPSKTMLGAGPSQGKMPTMLSPTSSALKLKHNSLGAKLQMSPDGKSKMESNVDENAPQQ